MKYANRIAVKSNILHDARGYSPRGHRLKSV